MTPYEKAVQAAMWIEFTAPVKVSEFTFLTMFNAALAALSVDGPVVVIDGKVAGDEQAEPTYLDWCLPHDVPLVMCERHPEGVYSHEIGQGIAVFLDAAREVADHG